MTGIGWQRRTGREQARGKQGTTGDSMRRAIQQRSLGLVRRHLRPTVLEPPSQFNQPTQASGCWSIHLCQHRRLAPTWSMVACNLFVHATTASRGEVSLHHQPLGASRLCRRPPHIPSSSFSGHLDALTSLFLTAHSRSSILLSDTRR